ncbi:MAG: saccharopine dehydrogenase NADP-binding domain-containing protein [Verrucomicrobiales bacterium]|nr:saccharopine dehydrogenase NADP-binding domain-containing protein [Verrucomicrobiales bacterium]MCP5526897.1 saccharopine dehydrogenase NADP-binding domain-containing protein [Verrucomicrobiales bacterium]
MKVFCLGGAGRICREAVLDLVQHSGCEAIVVADFDPVEGRRVVEWLADPRVSFQRVDVRDHTATVAAMQGFDVVMDGTTIKLNGLSTACIAAAGCHGINLNGFGEEDASDAVFRANRKACVPGFGMTPGVTQMMAMHAAGQLETVETVRVSHGAFRPIAFSASITETTTYEYDPALPGRVVFEDGEFKQVPPFARPREVQLPPPYGRTVQYIIPHAETRTLAQALAGQGVRLIEVRGTWPERNMRLVRALYEYGFLRNERVRVNDAEVGVLEAIAAYLMQSKEGTETELYGYSLHVEVEGQREGRRFRHTLTHTHPASDGSEPDWAGLRAYTRNVGIPMAIGATMLATGRVSGTGVLIPEEAFEPAAVFAELKRRRIEIHEAIETL